jgi:YbbR domain-containing protein
VKRRFSRVFSENLSYKIVALFITLILWLTILGRRDFILTKTVDIELLTAPSYTVVAQTAEQVKFKVSGPRSALKKYLDSSLSHAITLDISDKGAGVVNVEIPVGKMDVPLGVKIISVRPSKIQAEISLVKESKSGRNKDHQN